MNDDGTFRRLQQRNVSRRDFMKFCAGMAATLALPASAVSTIAGALEQTQKPYVVWLSFQHCAGDAASLFRAGKPTIAEMLLDVISLDYHEMIMASGGRAEHSLAQIVKKRKGKYIAIVEGSIPVKDGGVYCMIGGRTAHAIAEEVCGNAAATIAAGSCASWGGVPSAAPNFTGAAGVQGAVPGITVVNLPGCPVNAENLAATIVHFQAFGAAPPLDDHNRPLFAYGKRIHDLCERRGHFDAGRFVRQWGDKAHRKGWCLSLMGCKGAETYMNCPSVKFNEGTSWPVQGGHGCIACAEEHNWDAMSPFYKRPLSSGFFGEPTAGKIGAGLAVATAAGLAAYGVNRAKKRKRNIQE